MNMKIALLLVPCLLTACAQKSRTPAAWFDEATRVLQKNYYGYQVEKLKPLIEKHRSHFQATCASGCSWPQVEAQLQKLLTELGDPHTSYRTPEQLKQDQTDQRPDAGMRLAFLPEKQAHVILRVQEGSPAAKAGMRRGDAITAVNGVPCTPANEKLLKKTIQSGKPFKVSFESKNTGKKELPLQSTVASTGYAPTLSTQNLPAGVGLLTVPDFDAWEKISPRIHALVKQATDAKLNTLIVDLRDNPGGYVYEMLSSASAFMKQVDLIDAYPKSQVHLVGWEGKIRQVGKLYLPFIYKAPPAAFWKGKVIALVNRRTASAAEVLAYNLQLQKRALVIGEPTRGLMNTTTDNYKLSNGGALSITITRSLDTNKKPYPERITPDLQVKDDLVALMGTGRDAMLERAIRLAQSGTAVPEGIR